MTRHILKLFNGTTVDLGTPVDINDTKYQHRIYSYSMMLTPAKRNELLEHAKVGHILYHAVVSHNGTEYCDNAWMLFVYIFEDSISVSFPMRDIKTTAQRYE